MDKFTLKVHTSIYPAIDSTRVELPPRFTVCIIGGSAGIGEHIAYAYAHARASAIIIASRSLEPLKKVAETCRAVNPECNLGIFQCDINSSSSVAALASHIQMQHGRLDVLISNPAYAGPVTLKVTEGDPAEFQKCFDVNIMGTYHAAHYFIPLLLSSDNGANTFITIGSLAACIIQGPIANTGYCISKMAQSRFTEFLTEQYADEGLLSINVHPGAVATEMAKGNTPEEFLPYLTDDVDLCGGFLVWLTRSTKKMQWLNGRFVSATWDVEELLSRKDEIVAKDMLKWKMATA
jgi:NAD(P)-dependent dehydrogenase (short-subunit alcohol dehydrogenase family)